MVDMKRWDGTYVLKDKDYTIPAYGMLSLYVCSYDIQDTYGTIKVRVPDAKHTLGGVLRISNVKNKYRFQTRLFELPGYYKGLVSGVQADFTSDIRTGDKPLTVNFSDLSTGDPISWMWDFDGDGRIDSTKQNPNYVYETAGEYTVKLVVNDKNGRSEAIKEQYVQVRGADNKLPFANFTSDVRTGAYPLTVNFTDSSTQSPISWLWNFGDNTSSGTQNPSHTYTTPGIYTVVLKASNSFGFDTETKRAYILVGTPVADFTASITSGNTPLVVSFTDQTTNSPTSWSWDFNNDGIIDSTEQNPEYTYDNAGVYSVLLIVSNAHGTDSIHKQAYVTVITSSGGTGGGTGGEIGEPVDMPDPPIADFTASEVTGNAPFMVSFTDLSTGEPISWTWDFNGDGIADKATQNANHTYYEAGVYTVTLTVGNSAGIDTMTKTAYITVNYNPPIPNFHADITRGLVPLTVPFTDTSLNAESWAWDFGDGGTETVRHPVYTYNEAGIYTVTLTITNSMA